MRIEHRPAGTIQVDWAGDTGELVKVFITCSPYSNYLYAEGFYRTDEEAWVNAHAHMFSFSITQKTFR